MSEAKRAAGLELPEAARAPFRLMMHLVLGTALFAALLYAAVLLAAFAKWLEHRYTTPDWFAPAVGVVEMAIFATDVLLYGAMVLSESAQFLRTLWREFKDG